MFVIPKLRLNRFKSVPVPSSRRLFELFGLSDPLYESQSTAQDVQDVIPVGAKKTQLLGLGAEMADKAREFAENPSATDPLTRTKPRDK